MKHLLAYLLLPAAMLPTWGQTPDTPDGSVGNVSPEELRTQLQTLLGEAQKMEETAPKGSLQKAVFNPDSPMPEARPGQSAATADGGLIFDNANSLLTYIGNVRLNDEHLRLRAAHSLFIHLPKNEQDKPEQAAQPQSAPSGAPQKAPQPPPEKKEDAPSIPAHVTTDQAAVDIPGSRVLLIGRCATPSLTLTRGSDSMVLQSAGQNAPARVFSNPQGDVLMEGRQMVFVWHNDKGEQWKLEVAAGPVVYSGQERCLRIRGVARLTSASGNLDCDESMTLVFAPSTAPSKAADTPFAAFATMQFKEVKLATAKGHVVLTTPATATRPASIAKSDCMEYDPATGNCTLKGLCSLVYGGNSLAADGQIQLLPNGDATICSRQPISGTYERPTPGDPAAAPIAGTWSTPGHILYKAQDNCFIFPRGLAAQDALATFSCTGELQVYTAPRAQAPRAPQHMQGKLNLAITQQEEVRRVLATGDVRLHSEATATAPVCDMKGDSLEAHIPTAELLLKAADDRRAHARYGDYELDALAPAGGESTVHLLPNGDLHATGDELLADMPSEKGPIHMVCTRELTLQREAAILILGDNSRIDSPDGILTARAPLHAELEQGAKPTRAPKQYPHLTYNFSGLRRASTPHGGTLRTTQASLQCEGAISIELAPGASASDNPRKNLRAAMARDSVSVAGKDSTGRLLRANGDRLDFDPASGNFYLRGNKVSLADRYNTHSASGAGACVILDPQNNVHISGRHQTTTAHRIHEQLEKNKKK